jgi:hypothetical protein
MKRSFTSAAVLLALAFPASALVGCDQTLSKSESVTTRSDGTQIKKSDTVKRQADGTIVREQEREVNR